MYLFGSPCFASNFVTIIFNVLGSAALYHAAKRGLKCLGLDRFPPAHDRGSSHGESRLIRLSYFEHQNYVPLLRRSYQLWDELDPALLVCATETRTSEDVARYAKALADALKRAAAA